MAKNSSYQAQQSATEPLDRQQRIDRSNRLFLPDGTAHLAYLDYQSPENQRARIYDTNDQLLWQGNEDELPDRYLKWPGSTRRYSYSYYLRRLDVIYPEPRRSIVIPVLKGRDIVSFWRFEISGGYFAGFDKDGNRIGYCGPAGFVQEQSQIQSLGKPEDLFAWIPIQGGGPIVLWQTENRLYQIDFKIQTIERLLQFSDKKIKRFEVHGWMKLAANSELYLNNQMYRPMILCTTEDDSVIVILQDPAETIHISMPEESDARITNVIATRERIYMRAIDSGLNPPKEIILYSDAYMKWVQERMKEPIELAEELYEVDSTGHVTLINKFEWTAPPRQIISQADSPQEKWRKALSTASPPFYDLFGRFFIRFFGRQLNNDNRELYQFFIGLLHFAPSFHTVESSYNPLSYLLSVVMAGIVFFHAWPRRTSTAGLIGWIVFAALFNIVGLLVYLALNHTPTIQCHKCNKRRGLNSPRCPHCGADVQIIAPDMLNIIAGT